MKDFMFTVPASVPAGSSVTITNNDSEAHTVTSKDGGFDVKVAGRGGTAQLTAPKAGTYTLTCDFHANMKGTLVVT
ncbi:MAG: cupredoxin domain-containing protein [Lapillicoccus sp.]